MDKDGILFPRTAAAIRRARARGIHIVLATGRAYHGVKHLVKDLDLVDPLILDNGALITTAQGEVIWQEAIPTKDTKVLLDYCRIQDLTIVFTADDLVHIFIPHRDRDQKRVLRDINSFGLHNRRLVQDWGQLPREQVLKIMVSGQDPVHVRQSMENWPSNLHQLNYGLSLPLWLEINGEEVDKAKALEFVAADLKIPAAAVLAAGDGETDIPMLKWARTGILVKEDGVSVFDGRGFPPPRPVKEGAAWALEVFALV
ncbi:MAG TPA: HAD-IIB family hydrolase [Firmicutes bacterium]|nr:HAD-IIB family hydrolase [Bacillota bacterium]